jgi:hypothetical protein
MSDVSYLLIVETNSYAGNFERELTAWATGVVGECGVGDDAADEFLEAAVAMGYTVDDDENLSPFADLMELRIDESDDTPCMRPCRMAKNEAGEFNNVEMHLYRTPSEKDLAFIAFRINSFPEYWKHNVKILGIKLLKRETVVLDSEVWSERYAVQ